MSYKLKTKKTTGTKASRHRGTKLKAKTDLVHRQQIKDKKKDR